MVYKKSWKYILIKDNSENCKDLGMFQIKALKDFSNVTKGDLGGYIKGYYNLSQFEDCWVYDKASVYTHARVFGNAVVKDEAQVYGIARVFGNAIISEQSMVFSNAQVFGNAQVYGHAKVYEKAVVSGNAEVSGYALVCDTHVCGKTIVKTSYDI